MAEATDLTVRPAAESDLPDVLALYGQPDFNNGRVVSLMEAERLFRRMKAYPDFRLYVAELSGAIVGTFCLAILDNIAHWGTPSALVENVVVSDAVQSEGIGRAMMGEALRKATSSGCYKVALSSNARNHRAHAFYEGLGFERHGYSFRLDLPVIPEMSA